MSDSEKNEEYCRKGNAVLAGGLAPLCGLLAHIVLGMRTPERRVARASEGLCRGPEEMCVTEGGPFTKIDQSGLSKRPDSCIPPW